MESQKIKARSRYVLYKGDKVIDILDSSEFTKNTAILIAMGSMGDRLIQINDDKESQIWNKEENLKKVRGR